MTSIHIRDYNPMDLVFGVVEEFGEGIRHPEDGEQLYDIAVYVTATAPNGVRWYREVGAAVWVTGTDGDFDMPMARLTDNPVDLNEKAAKVADRLNESKTRRLNPDVWFYAGAVYGSSAYQSLGIEETTAAMEKMEF